MAVSLLERYFYLAASNHLRRPFSPTRCSIYSRMLELMIGCRFTVGTSRPWSHSLFILHLVESVFGLGKWVQSSSEFLSQLTFLIRGLVMQFAGSVRFLPAQPLDPVDSTERSQNSTTTAQPPNICLLMSLSIKSCLLAHSPVSQRALHCFLSPLHSIRSLTDHPLPNSRPHFLPHSRNK